MKNTILLLVSFFLLGANISSADNGNGAKIFIEDLGNNIIKIANNNKIPIKDRRRELINLIDRSVDSKWISKFVLGRHYRKRSQAEKDKFQKLYREFMINTYAPKFTGYNGEKFEIQNIINQENYYTVKCLFYTKDESPAINIDFRVKNDKKSLQFLVFDIVAEGISLIETQRSEFGSAISNSGFDKFLLDLEDKIKSLEMEKNS